MTTPQRRPTQEALPFSGRPACEAEAEAEAVLAGVVERRAPAAVYALFSGGHDSLCATHLASRHPAFSGVVHVNTGVGIERTRRFVRETCAAFGWPLREMRPPGPPFKDKGGLPWGLPTQTAYEAMVHRWGFPSPKGHTLMYNRLKERCVAALVREHMPPGGCRHCGLPAKRHRGRSRPHPYEPHVARRVVLVTGVRRQESRRRMGHIVSEQAEGASRVWCAPLVDWDQRDKAAYIQAHSLPKNPVVEALCMSAECLCGAYARPGELDMIACVCPQTAAYIRSLEAQIAGSDHIPPHRRRWGNKPPRGERKDRDGKQQQQPSLPMCHSCESAREREEEEAGSRDVDLQD